MDSTSIALTISASLLFLLYTLHTTRHRMYLPDSNFLTSQLESPDPVPESLQKRRKLSEGVCIVEIPVVEEPRVERQTKAERRERGTETEKAGKRGREVDPREAVRTGVEEKGKLGSQFRLYDSAQFQEAKARFFSRLNSAPKTPKQTQHKDPGSL